MRFVYQIMEAEKPLFSSRKKAEQRVYKILADWGATLTGITRGKFYTHYEYENKEEYEKGFIEVGKQIVY